MLFLRKQEANLEIWDPACGDGSLLVALQACLGAIRANFHGLDTDTNSVAVARENLAPRKGQIVDIKNIDFLDFYEKNLIPGDLFSLGDNRPFADVIIANPPYVRTQLLGIERSKRIASNFNLTGRVDLYHAFMVAMTELLRPGGVIGVITSNRFMFTQAGAALRELLLSNYEVLEIFDLGDTKFFKAAVLPCIIIARKAVECSNDSIPFTRIYETNFDPSATVVGNDRNALFPFLASGISSKVTVSKTTFRIGNGFLDVPALKSAPWALRNPTETTWINRVNKRPHRKIGDLLKVKVGIKTTADNVFIRNDWEKIPEHQRPEPELLLPLTDRFRIDRWLPREDTLIPKVLYPYDMQSTKRRPISLDAYPRAAAYLNSHADQLKARDYVLKSGREWFEIWVPHQPRDWSFPKVVFPDISQRATFAFVDDGSIVNGNCYWFSASSNAERLYLYLLLGVCNSKFMAYYHGLAFNNVLYSGRRRYLTQYVAKYPVPDPDCETAQQIVKLVCELLSGKDDTARIETDIDTLLQDFFRVKLPKID